MFIFFLSIQGWELCNSRYGIDFLNGYQNLILRYAVVVWKLYSCFCVFLVRRAT